VRYVVVMNKRDDTLHIRMDASDRAILDALASKAGEDFGLDLTNSDLVRMAIKRLPTSPAELFRPPAGEGRA
jgi:hypothetical protein